MNDNINLNDLELFSIFIFGSVNQSFLNKFNGYSLEDIIEYDYSNISRDLEVIDVDISMIGGDDYHSYGFNKSQNGINLKFVKSGTNISGFDLEYTSIKYIGSIDDQYEVLKQKFNDIGIDLTNKTNPEIKNIMENIDDIKGFWDIMEI